MMTPQEEEIFEKRLLNIILDFKKKMPQEIKIFFEEKGVHFEKFYGDYLHHHTFAMVPIRQPNLIRLNYFNLPEISDISILGVLAHELGHSYALCGCYKLHNYLLKFIPLSKQNAFEEWIADNLAKKWGFKKEISYFRKDKQATFYVSRFTKIPKDLDVYNELKEIPEETSSLELYFLCPKCNASYKIYYHLWRYFDIETELLIFKNNRARIRNHYKYPISPKRIQENAFCMDCEIKLDFIKSINPMQDFMDKFNSKM